MTIPYDNLRQFLGGYFHQDWNLEGDNDSDIVEMFLREEPRELVGAVVAELDELLHKCMIGNENVDAVLLDSMSFYYYQADGLNGLEWLQRIRMLLTSKSEIFGG